LVDVAVAGTGFWGVNHVRVLKDIPDCDVVGVCDVDVSRAEATAKRFGVKAFFNSVDEMLAKVRPDAVTVCTPSTTHHEIALKVLRAGCDVLIEKPMSPTVEEGVEIVRAAEKMGRLVMVGFIERFNPAVRKAYELIMEGEIGDVLIVYGRRIGWWPERIGDVGVVMDTAIHDVDLVNWFLKGLPKTVYARCGRLRHSHEDHAQIFLSFSDGQSALIESNWLTPRKKREMHITGSGGVISVKFIEQELILEKENETTIPNIKYSEPLRAELNSFVECVRKGQKPLVDGYDGLRATFVSECVLKSSQLGRPVELDEEAEKKGVAKILYLGIR